MKNNKETMTELENLIDGLGLQCVLEMTSQICYLKSQHVEENWQDTHLAKCWNKAGNKIAKITCLFYNL